jgi:hypothetical protein
MTRDEYARRLRERESVEVELLQEDWQERHEPYLEWYGAGACRVVRPASPPPFLLGTMRERVAVIRALRAELARVEGES